MKATILLFTSILLVSFGCEKNCLPDEYNYTYDEGKGIVFTYDSTQHENNFKMQDGPFVLFQYSHLDGLCENEIDRGWGENLVFAIPDSLTEFNFVDSAILQTNCYYYDDSGVHYILPVKNGVIEGNKIANGDWSVKVDIYARPESSYGIVELKHIKFEGIYTK